MTEEKYRLIRRTLKLGMYEGPAQPLMDELKSLLKERDKLAKEKKARMAARKMIRTGGL